MNDFAAASEEAQRQQTIADLKGARRELVARGRCRDQLLEVDTGRVCLLGALCMASVDGFEHQYGLKAAGAAEYMTRPKRARKALEEQLRSIDAKWDGVPAFYFNDAEETTDQDVLDLIDKTLAGLGGLG